MVRRAVRDDAFEPPHPRQQIRLPSVTTITQLTPIYDPVHSDQMSGYLFSQSGSDKHFYRYTFEEFRHIAFKKVVLSSWPTTILTTRGGGGRGFTAMAILTAYCWLAIARPGEDKWILMRNWPSVTDIIYRNGKFLGVSNEGNLLSFDATSLEVTKIAQGWARTCGGIDKYLVDSDGDLLMVWRDCDDQAKTSEIIVMKFFEEKGTWLHLKSLGDNSLFLGVCCSISLSVRKIPELRPNCVYYTEVLWDWMSEDQEEIRMPREVWVFNLEDQTFDHYAPTDHRLYWPPPIWIMPSLL